MEFRAGKYQNAVNSYTRALEMHSGSAIAYANRAMAYLKLKQYAPSLCEMGLDYKTVILLYGRITEGVVYKGYVRIASSCCFCNFQLHQGLPVFIYFITFEFGLSHVVVRIVSSFYNDGALVVIAFMSDCV